MKVRFRSTLVTAFVTVLGVALLAAPTPASAAPTAPSDVTTTHQGPEGRLRYQVHVPPAQAAGRPLPVVVALHGCGMTGFGFNSMRDMTDLNRLADAKGFLVVYPTQDLLRGLPIGCWSTDDPAHQRRGRGEPALVAGVTREVVETYGADPARVHVLGASSGAALAQIMAVTYPDLYATVMPLAGGEYTYQDVLPDPTAISAVDTGKRAWAEMGSRARPVPALVVTGDEDDAVLPMYTDRLVTHWATIDDLAVDGRLDGDMDDVAESVRRVRTPGLRDYTRSTYRPRGGGRALVEKVVVHGMGHAWPGPGTGLFVDNVGPDMARIWWRFASVRSKR